MQTLINTYLEIFPAESDGVTHLLNQLKSEGVVFNRKNFTGHIVANTLVLNKDMTKVLCLFHNTLKMYLQPGGHVDEADKSVIEAAFRELEEETGIKKYKLHPWHLKNKDMPIYIESHLIPENLKKGEGEHYHHDFMYAVIADDENVNLQLDEVSDFLWIDVETVIKTNSFIAISLKKLFNL